MPRSHKNNEIETGDGRRKQRNHFLYLLLYLSLILGCSNTTNNKVFLDSNKAGLVTLPTKSLTDLTGYQEVVLTIDETNKLNQQIQIFGVHSTSNLQKYGNTSLKIVIHIDKNPDVINYLTKPLRVEFTVHHVLTGEEQNITHFFPNGLFSNNSTSRDENIDMNLILSEKLSLDPGIVVITNIKIYPLTK